MFNNDFSIEKARYLLI